MGINGNYYGNYWRGNSIDTVIVTGDVANGINWDNVKDNQSAANFIGNFIKFKNKIHNFGLMIIINLFFIIPRQV